MDNFKEVIAFVFTCLAVGTIGHILMYLVLYFGRQFFRAVKGATLSLGNAGEAGSGEGNTGNAGTGAGDGNAGIKFTAEQQKEIDRVIAVRLSREREKFSDYDNVKQKLSQYEQADSEKQQKSLEEAKKYEEAKQTYEMKLKKAQEELSVRDRNIQDLQITHALTNEVFKQNGFVEESLALLKNTAIIKEGKVLVKVRDENGLDDELPVEEGVKRFLTSRPHLVKAQARSGAGTPPAGGNNNGGGSVGSDLATLNSELINAMNAGDAKKVSDIKNRIRGQLKNRGVTV